MIESRPWCRHKSCCLPAGSDRPGCNFAPAMLAIIRPSLLSTVMIVPLALAAQESRNGPKLGVDIGTQTAGQFLAWSGQPKVGIIGGWLVGVVMIGIDEGSFWSQMQGGVEVWNDVGNGVIKSMVFGVAVTFVALYQGYMAHPTPEGVSSATTRTVVMASLLVLGLDFLLTAMMFSI